MSPDGRNPRRGESRPTPRQSGRGDEPAPPRMIVLTGSIRGGAALVTLALLCRGVGRRSRPSEAMGNGDGWETGTHRFSVRRGKARGVPVRSPLPRRDR
jgi:hypothetical protein